MRNMLLIIKNNLSVTFRKKGNIIIYLFLPIAGVLLSLLIYGNAGNDLVRVGIADEDGGVFSRNLKASLQSSDIFKTSDVKAADINEKILQSNLDAAIVIPKGYTEGIYRGKPENLQVISLKGQDTTAWINQRLNSYTGALARLSAASNGDRALLDRMYGQYMSDSARLSVVKLKDQKTGKQMALQSVGFLIMFVMLGTAFISTMILKEKRDRTYYRICSAPVGARQYIAANSITSLIIVVVQIIIIQLVMKFVFKINTGIGDIELFIILLLFGLVAIGIGLVITAFSSSSYMAGTLGTLIMTPTCMLGGCFWSIDFMPDFMQKIGYFVPQRWAMDAITKLQYGGAQADIAINLLILSAFAVALILVAVYKFSRSANMQKFV